MLESVALICGHCQGLLLHLRITFDPPQRWTLISVALVLNLWLQASDYEPSQSRPNRYGRKMDEAT